ncbi:hypothetical protein VARIO8X_60165 [Burkholderiales bacterium 8X]|nr:hypothetical protein VARIO8X_60165 [Burkholderiales bacterium 8X]
METFDDRNERYSRRVDFSKKIEKVLLPSTDLGNSDSYELQKQIAYIAEVKECGIYAKLLPKHVTVLFHYPVNKIACVFQSAKGYFAQFLYKDQKLTETGIELLKFFYQSTDKERPTIYLIYDPAESLDAKGTAYKRAKRFLEAHQATAAEFNDKPGARIWTMALQPYTEGGDDWLLIRPGDCGLDIVTAASIEQYKEAAPFAAPKLKKRKKKK